MKTHTYLKTVLTALFLSLTLISAAQTWQWGLRGGTTDPMGNREEEVVSIVTDANDNMYTLSSVGIDGMDVDGHDVPTYGDYDGGGNASVDYVISSFACDGSYRWSKVIGGQESDIIQNLQLDAEGNIYVAGQVYNSADDAITPGISAKVHFGDIVIPYAVQGNGFESLFIMKFDSNGNELWLRRQQPSSITFSQSLGSHSIDFQADLQGNCYWLTFLVSGTYIDGALTVSENGYYLLKYDANGNFTGYSAFDMQYTGPGPWHPFRMRRNHNNGVIYLSGFLDKMLSPPDNFIISGNTIEYSKFIAAFDSNANYLWKKENNTTVIWSGEDYNIAFDAENNIYMTGRVGKTIQNNANAPMEGFNGQPFTTPPGSNLPVAFLVKFDEQGNTLWQTNAMLKNLTPYGITVNGDEVALCGTQIGIQWGTINYPNNNTGYDPFVLRFIKETGATIDYHVIHSANTASDYGTCLTADSQGNYLMGGRFAAANLTVGPDVLHNSGSDTDFFVAKLGAACVPLGVDVPGLASVVVSPNPVRDVFSLNNAQAVGYEIYSLLGVKVASGSVAAYGSISLEGKASGVYLLHLRDGDGERVLKVVKE